MSTQRSRLFSFGRIALLVAMAVGLALVGLRAYSSTPATAGHSLPHATIKIWDPNTSSPRFGNDPNMTVADPGGVTAHVATVADPLTIATVFENTICSGFPCGVTYWNPATNVFKCYGYSSGVMNGIDVNRGAPLKAPPAGTAAPPTNGGNYGPGDTWLAKTGSFSTTSAPGRPLTVQFPGTDLFRSWGAGNLSSIAMDQANGIVWYTDQNGFIGNFDPATNVTTRWGIGGRPRDVAVDSSGNAYATIESTNQIVRINPSAAVGSQVTLWAIPGGGLDASGTSFNDNPDGITIDSADRVWFAESVSNEIGRLDPAINEFAEYVKVGLDEPQNVSSSGSGGLLQTFWSEGNGSAVGIVTEVEAAGTSAETLTIVPPTTPAIAPTTATLTPADHTHAPTVKTIIPTVFDVPGVDGVPGSGATLDPLGNPIPGLLRFPMPAGSTRATGMTEVALPNTVFGSLIGSEQFFQLTSGAIIAPVEDDLGPTSLEVSKTAESDGRFVSGTIDITNVGENPARISAIEDSLEVHFPRRRGFTPPPLPDGSTRNWFKVADVSVSTPGLIPVGETVSIDYTFDLCDAADFSGANSMRNVVVVTLANRPEGAQSDTFETRSESFRPEEPDCPTVTPTPPGPLTPTATTTPTTPTATTTPPTPTDTSTPTSTSTPTETPPSGVLSAATSDVGAEGSQVYVLGGPLAMAGPLGLGASPGHGGVSPAIVVASSGLQEPIGPNSDWVFTGWGYEPAFAAVDSTDPDTVLCNEPE